MTCVAKSGLGQLSGVEELGCNFLIVQLAVDHYMFRVV